MELAIAGERVVDAVLADWALRLRTDAGSELRVEGPFVLSAPDGTDVALDPGTADTAEGGTDPVLAALHGRIVSAEAADGGALLLFLDDGDGQAELRVPPDADYEAWTCVTAAGDRVVCAPGGELVVWSSGTPVDS